jgi:hypothetical protein
MGVRKKRAYSANGLPHWKCNRVCQRLRENSIRRRNRVSNHLPPTVATPLTLADDSDTTNLRNQVATLTENLETRQKSLETSQRMLEAAKREKKGL